MKPFILVSLAVLTFIVGTPRAHAGWFGKDEKQQQIQKLENQLQHQQQLTGDWQGISWVLGITCVIATVVGCAIGSKARHGKPTPE